MVALRKESVDRNFFVCVGVGDAHVSLSARRAWIEMTFCRVFVFAEKHVALRKESVDRNTHICSQNLQKIVALRKESVDRNSDFVRLCLKMRSVALRKESVDRNHDDYLKLAKFEGSLSARRAWIEIVKCGYQRESCRSLSARRAWIEIPPSLSALTCGLVALRKESVDRNRCSYLHSNMSLVALRKESVDRNRKISR